jgi:hypothetical protein
VRHPKGPLVICQWTQEVLTPTSVLISENALQRKQSVVLRRPRSASGQMPSLAIDGCPAH